MKLFLLTGDKGSGKTTFCRQLREKAQTGGFSTAGILTLTKRDTRLTALDLFTGEEKILAVRNSKDSTSDRSQETVKWAFRQECLDWGNRQLKETPPADLFILDEAGILEFERGQGWQQGLIRADFRIDRIGLLVIRPSLLQKAQERWPEALILRVKSSEWEKSTALQADLIRLLHKGIH